MGMTRPHRMRRFAAAVFAIAVAASVVACSPERSGDLDLPAQVDGSFPAEAQQQLQAAVDRAVAASGASGALVGVWAPWAGSWVAGTGAVAPDGAATSTDAAFTVGSVTRAMTCDVLHGLAAQGTVGLDDPVGQYVSGIPGHESLTLEQLCDSTAGLAPFGPSLAPRFAATPERSWKPRELLAYGTGVTTTGTPGTVFADSDTGYVLLGLALERASHRPAADLLQEFVFTPMGMPASSLPTAPPTDIAGLWTPDGEDGKPACAAPVEVGPLSPSAGFTAAGVVSDLRDLGRYTQALAMGARAYDAPARFGDPLPATPDAPSWFTATGGAYQAGTLIGQYGATLGHLTAAFADRNTGMTVVVTLNNSRASDVLVRSLAWQLAAIASKIPAAAGQTAPAAGLPWTVDDMAGQIAGTAVCPLP